MRPRICLLPRISNGWENALIIAGVDICFTTRAATTADAGAAWRAAATGRKPKDITNGNRKINDLERE